MNKTLEEFLKFYEFGVSEQFCVYRYNRKSGRVVNYDILSQNKNKETVRRLDAVKKLEVFGITSEKIRPGLKFVVFKVYTDEKPERTI